jgi:hypothetical protein
MGLKTSVLTRAGGGGTRKGARQREKARPMSADWLNWAGNSSPPPSVPYKTPSGNVELIKCPSRQEDKVSYFLAVRTGGHVHVQRHHGHGNRLI